jgi:thiamine-monophosphate kinase
LHYKKNSRFPIGIGDDAAIRAGKAGENLILTADSMVENVHFSLDYMTFQEVGYKAMAANLSDVAAMGAVADCALVQLIFPENGKPGHISRDIRSIYEGMSEACRTWNFPIIGGNLSKGPCFIIDITLIGRYDKKGRSLLRKGIKKGDNLWVSGFPGQSAAGLAALQKWGSRKNIPRSFRPLIRKHIRPVPRIELGWALAQNVEVHAMIDVSDGIAKECHTLAFENDRGIILEPLDTGILDSLQEIRLQLQVDPLRWFLYGGEDYELLFSASPRFNPSRLRIKDSCPLTKIGKCTSSAKGVHLKIHNDTIKEVEKSGWDNLRGPSK